MNRSLNRWLVLLILLASFGLASQARAQAQTFYVSSTGSDSGDGSYYNI